MPYNSYFPAGYQPVQNFYPQYAYAQPNPQPQAAQPTPQAQQNPQPINNNIIWVQGEAGAKSYLVAPNTTVQLWDSERQTIYLKSADASGMPSIKTLEYTIREMPQNNVVLTPDGVSSTFATKDEVNILAERITALQSKIDGFTAKPVQRSKKDVSEGE